MKPKLQIIICSTRPGRIGPSIANWFNDFCNSHDKFDVELIDLAAMNLPLYDEPNHPRMQKYQHEHTLKWSASVARADAYVFVTPEYNYSPPPSLVNALDFLYNEWNYKPCGFVSYGGLSGGLRAVQAVKLLVTTLKMMPMTESVAVPMAWSLLKEDKSFSSNDAIDNSATQMLDELLKWTDALKTLRSAS